MKETTVSSTFYNALPCIVLYNVHSGLNYIFLLGHIAIIAAFQARLNENANNIVDALISLRFSVSPVFITAGTTLHFDGTTGLTLVRFNSIYL